MAKKISLREIIEEIDKVTTALAAAKKNEKAQGKLKLSAKIKRLKKIRALCVVQCTGRYPTLNVYPL